MRKLLLLLILALGGVSLQAQQRISGQWALKASGGVQINNLGYSASLGFEKLFQNTKHSIQFEIAFRGQKFNTRPKTEQKIQGHTYEALAYYNYTFVQNRILYISVMGGGFLGYESYSLNHSELFLEKSGNFTAGIAIASQIEFKTSKRLNLFVQPTFLYNIASPEENARILALLGGKYYF